MYRQKIVYFQDSQRKDGGGGENKGVLAWQKRKLSFSNGGIPPQQRKKGA